MKHFTNASMRLRLAAIAMCLCIASGTLFAQISVKGRVLDQSGEAVIGASIVEKGTTNGAITDFDGNFELTTHSDKAVLVFSYVGFTSQEMAAAAVMNVTLQEDTKVLEDVVVVGYGVQKKSSVTGAISQVKSEDMQNRTVTDAQSALQGKTAGVQVIAASAPGKASSIRVRGISSNGSSEPLYVVDGVRLTDISGLEPNDIESMEVLKDAASAAIYGAEAGNGVILITTKKGKNGKIRIGYEFQLSSQSLSRKPRMLNGEEYINYMSESGVLDRQTLENYWTSGETTDWLGATFENSLMMKHNLNLSGGNDKGSFFMSFSYLDNNGIIAGPSDKYKRIAATVNADYKLTKWLKVGATTNMAKFDRTEVASGEYGLGLIYGALSMDPLTPVCYEDNNNLPTHVTQAMADGHTLLKDNDGHYYGISNFMTGNTINPLINRDRMEANTWGYNVNGSLYADLTPVEGLTITSRLGYNLYESNTTQAEHRYYGNPEKLNDYAQGVNSSGSRFYYQWENFANYAHTFNGGHSINFMAGLSFQKTDNNSQMIIVQPNGEDAYTMDKEGFFYPDFASATATRKISGQRTQTAKFSYFFRGGYDYKGRYMIQASLRADAADLSMLPKENRWGYFPAVSAGWAMSEEEWWEPISDKWNVMKLRASWGQNGSLASLGNYLYSTTIVNSGSYNYTAGAAPSTTGNSKLKWETSEQLDFGIDARWLNGRLNASMDYYIKNTKDLLVNGTVPTLTLGGTMSYINAGNIRNSGFEFELGWRDKVGDFEYGIRGNLATLKNEVTYLDPSLSRIQGATSDGYYTYPTYFEKGHAAYYFRGYKYAGVDENGDPLFEDLDGSGVGGDDGDLTDIGNAIPKLTYGVTVNFAWKGLELIVFGSGTQGNQNYLQMTNADEAKTNRLASVFYDGRWVAGADNSNATKPRAGMANMDKYLHSDAMVFDASYFRIKQIQLGYTLPQKWTKKILVNNFRLYCSLDDFFTITRYPGLDPEVAPLTACALGVDKGSYPSSRKVVFGFNIEF